MLYFFLPCINSHKKSAVIHIFVPLSICHFCLVAFRFCFTQSLVFCNYDVPWFGFIFVSFPWILLIFFIWGLQFLSNLEKFEHYFFLSPPFSSLLTLIAYMLDYLMLSYRSLMISSFIESFVSLCFILASFYYLSLSSWILSSTVSSMLLIPSSSFLNFQYVVSFWF